MTNQIGELCARGIEVLKTGQIAAAGRLAAAALALGPNDPNALLFAALYEAGSGREEKALSMLAPIVAGVSDAAGLYRSLAEILTQANAIGAASLFYQKSLDLQPSAETYVALARALTRRANGTSIEAFVAVERAARQAVALASDNWEAHYLLGSALEWQSRSGDAETVLRQACALKPDQPDVLRRLGKLVLGRGDTEAALPIWQALGALLPGDSEVVDALAACDPAPVAATEGKHRERKRVFSRTPTDVTLFADLERAVRDFILPEYEGIAPVIGRKSRILTMGSCFAGNVARVLETLGVAQCSYVGLGESVNSSYANRAFLDWVHGRAGETAAKVFGGLYRKEPAHFRQLFVNADIVIFTLGVAACFFDRDSGGFLLSDGQPSSTFALARRADFRTTTVAENLANLRAIIASVREFNPAARFIFTVSPVALAATFERSSAILADCVSKSTLRVTVEELLKEEIPNTHYWPAFEIVRWLGAYHPGMYGEQDGSSLHVSERVVGLIMRLFLEVFGEPGLAAALRPAEAAANG